MRRKVRVDTFKNWTVTATKDGKTITLYTANSDGAVQLDSMARERGELSLVAYGREGRSPAVEPVDDQRDLAIGAFKYHCASRQLDWSEQTLRLCDSFPSGLENFRYGGITESHGTTFAVAVHEQPGD